MKHRRKLIILGILSLILCALFLSIGLNAKNFQYALSRRIPITFSIILTGAAIAVSSTVFQTITNNRILTPSILGLDSLYVFIQTFVVFVLGSTSGVISNNNINFIMSISLMVVFSLILFRMLFKKEGSSIYFLLLVGIIFGTLFQSLSSFMQMVIDPNEFAVVQDKMFASFNNINTQILPVAFAVIILAIAYVFKKAKILDVLSLGRDQAINLGVDYDKTVKKMLVVVSILVSISTALVGPITFLGLLVVNLSREFLNTYKHNSLVIGSTLISIVALIGGQLIVERLLNFSATLSVIINLVGGLYFIYLLLKEEKA